MQALVTAHNTVIESPRCGAFGLLAPNERAWCASCVARVHFSIHARIFRRLCVALIDDTPNTALPGAARCLCHEPRVCHASDSHTDASFKLTFLWEGKAWQHVLLP